MKANIFSKSLKLKAVVMVAAILVLVIGALTAYLTYAFSGSYKTALQEKSSVVGNEFINELAKALNLGLPLDSLGGVSDKCKDIVQKHADIGYCIVTDTDGKVLFADKDDLVGQKLTDAASTAAARAEQQMTQTNTYDKNKFYETVIPVKDAEEKHVGALRLGLSSEHVDKQIYSSIMKSVLVALISLLVAVIAVGVFITRTITDPITYLVDTATLIAKGDLTKSIKVGSGDELGALGGAINGMVENLKNMLARVKDASVSVANATERIAINSKKISEGAQVQYELTESTSSAMEQMNASIKEVAESVESLSASAESSSSSIMEMAASIDEVAASTSDLSSSVEATSSSIMEMAASVKQVAENVDILSSAAEDTTASATEMGASVKEVENASKESATLSDRVTSEATELGMKAVEKTIQSMEGIKDNVEKASNVIEQLGGRSEEIGEILNVIDEVTDQTSLLALNAAILAAQAGEHGKGFAVVANEIKELAERTSSSTQEISNLISSVQSEAKDAVKSIKSGKDSVEEGVKIAYEAKEALGKIVESSSKAATMSKSIEKATVEQSEGVRQVSDAMVAISDMVQQILKATQEQSTGAEQIMNASEKMSLITKQFKNAMTEQSKGSKQITQAVENVSDKVQHIASATAEQRKGSEEIVKAVDKIRDITSQSVNLAEEMDHSVMELSKQADILREEINHFVLMSDYNLTSGTLRFGLAPIEDASIMKKRFSKLGEYLSEKLGVKVELMPGRDLATAVNDLGMGRTDIGYLTPTTFIEASHKYGAKVLVKALCGGKPFTHSVIVVKEGSGISKISEIAGKRFAFGDEKSTTSHLMPRAMLNEAGVKLQDLKAYDYLGRHDAVAKAVLAGEFDAGGIMEAVAARYAREGLKVIARSDDIPTFNIVCGPNFTGENRSRLVKALLQLEASNPEHSAILKEIDPDYEGFTEASDVDYDGIRKMVKQLYGITYN
jgi:phosphate/phosphite/phosphonate ABC transporter binding protein